MDIHSADHELRRRILQRIADGEPPERIVLSMKQVACYLNLGYHRIKVLRAARKRYDRAEAARTGLDPAPYVHLATALPRPLNGGTTYLATDIEEWAQLFSRVDPTTGQMQHATPPGRPARQHT